MIGAITAGLYGTGVPPVTNSYESIATVTVGSGGSSSISFSSIPSTYKHLQIRGIAQELSTSPGYDSIDIVLNSDAGANYSWHRLLGNGSAASADAGTSQNYGLAGTMYYTTAGASNVFNAVVADVLDYQNTNKYKTIRSLAGVDNNGAGTVGLLSTSWRSTSAVTSITLYPDNRVRSFAQYSSFALYGIKG